MYTTEKILEMLSSDKALVREEACEWLRFSQESSPEIVTALEKVTHDENFYIAEKAITALNADIHHQMVIKMGMIVPDKIVRDETKQTASDQPSASPAAQEETVPELVTPPAGLVRRVGAFLIDMLILATVCIVIGLFLGGLLERLGFYTRLISAVIALVYFSYCNSMYFDGSSPGKRMLHLRVKGADGGYISFKRALLRSSILVLVLLFIGWQLPVSSSISTLLLAVVIYGLGGAIVFLMLFNRGTGQSLHDLIAGTRVVYDRGNKIESYPETPRARKIGAIVTAIVLPLVVWGISQGVMKSPVVSSSMQEIMPLYRALRQDQRYYMAGVSSGYQQTTGQQLVRVLIITLWPRDNLDDLGRQKIAQDAVAVAQNYISLADYNGLQVRVASGYDLGFFSQLTVWYCAPPQVCQYKYVTTTLLHYFSFNATYTRE